MADVDGARWARNWTASIGSNVREARTREGLSQQQLADRCAEFGYPISRNSIMNIEGGRADTVSVQQLAMLAAALQVAPVELAFVVSDDEIEIVPGFEGSSFHAAEWFSGRSWIDQGNEAHGLVEPSPLLAHWRMHSDLIDELLGLIGVIFIDERDETPRNHAMLERRIADQERLIQVFRDGMRKSGMNPPPLGDDFAHLDRPARSRLVDPITDEEIREMRESSDGVDPEA